MNLRIKNLNYQKAKKILHPWIDYMVKIFFYIDQKGSKEKKKTYICTLSTGKQQK